MKQLTLIINLLGNLIIIHQQYNEVKTFYKFKSDNH